MLGKQLVTEYVESVGAHLIAKTSRFLADEDTLNYHRNFVRQHSEAQGFAQEYVDKAATLMN